MKQPMIASLLLSAFINHNVLAQTGVDVIENTVWVYPAITAKNEIMVQRGVKNHFLSTVVSIDREATKEVVSAAQAQYPQKEIKVYRVDYVEGEVKLPGGTSVGLSYTPLASGWQAKASYIKVNDADLPKVLDHLRQHPGVELKTSHYKRQQKEVVIYKTDCDQDTPHREGVNWLYDRLKKIEKDLAEVPSQQPILTELVFLEFGRRCMDVDAQGVNSFKALGENWRLTPRRGVLEVKEMQNFENFREFTPEIKSSVVSYEY